MLWICSFSSKSSLSACFEIFMTGTYKTQSVICCVDCGCKAVTSVASLFTSLSDVVFAVAVLDQSRNLMRKILGKAASSQIGCNTVNGLGGREGSQARKDESIVIDLTQLLLKKKKKLELLLGPGLFETST